jgi:glycosyltransferase involved in cell wall biosynthesis
MPQSNGLADQALPVAVDGTPLRGARTGVGQFCQGLLEALGRRDDVEVGAFALSRHGRAGIEALLPPGVKALGPPGPGIPGRVLNASWARWAFPPGELYSGRASVVHGTNFVVPPARRAAMVVSVHDLTPLHFPQWCRPAARAYPALVKKAVSRGAWVHADSAFVAQELTEMLDVPAERVRTVHLGVPPVHPGAPPGPVLPGWVTSYVLAIGTVEPRKDLPTLVRAFGPLAPGRPGLALVIAGSEGWGGTELDEAVAACPARDRVVRLGWVADEARDALTTGATVFAYPSRYEGFGLPPLHAMAAGTPVVAGDCGALREVLGDAARLVPPGDAEALADALGRLLDDPAQRRDLSRRGLERAAGYTWEACAQGMVSLYREAAAARGAAQPAR